jgi:hypothetical protein
VSTTTAPLEHVIEVFANTMDSAARIASIRAILDRTTEVARCRYLNHKASYEFMKMLFASSPSQTAVIAVLTPATTPPLFICHLRPGVAPAPVSAELRRVKGVYGVASNQKPPAGFLP